MKSESEYKQLEEDCKKWFNKCEELSTEKRQLERQVNQIQKENQNLKDTRELDTSFLSRYQTLYNEVARLSNLLTDVRSYILDGAEWGEIIAAIDAGLEE